MIVTPILTLLFFVAGAIKDRYGTGDLAQLGRLYGGVPRTVTVTVTARRRTSRGPQARCDCSSETNSFGEISKSLFRTASRAPCA